MTITENDLAIKGDNTAEIMPPIEEKAKPYGFGGWLYFVALGFLLTFGTSLYYLIDSILPIYQDGLISQMYDENWKYSFAIIFETVINIIYVVFPMFLGYLVFKKKKLLKYMVINFYIINFAVNIGYYFITNSIEEMATHDFMGEQGRNIVKSLVTCLIWIPYFINSKRVKNTYIN
ncbi:DUF2569 domain-containing protein [Paenibacillus aceris]|uniref:Phage-related holin n=1 Tax=Paenibacillus aceris TaxID=869555 RepID=A0ABS4I224_9BACL|nr:DUF2569 domain-containing protein [Paenibacillus aceris]MBP1964194.1 phage-related holin [Paenibacillus aceris]NHW36520.1 DUF2569 domain-containing protein [Paenibacillus aceris]